MKKITVVGMFLVSVPLSSMGWAATLWNQISNSAALHQSSWWDPDGSDYDQYVWDEFKFSSPQQITEIHWRGGYDPTRFGYGGPVLDFTVAICASINYGSGAPLQPDVINPPLVDYQVGGNAGETLVGTFNGLTMYDYSFILPTPFSATAGVWYWVQIEGWQHGIPDWGIAAGNDQSGYTKYFRCIANAADKYYQSVGGAAGYGLNVAGFNVSGTAVLGDFSRDNTSVAVTVELRGSTTGSYTVSLDSAGGFTISDVIPDTYAVWVKPDHWLANAKTGVVVINTDLNIGTIAFVNGDVNGDNGITDMDLSILTSVMDSSPPADARVDLDGDSEVTSTDLAILLGNMDLTGAL